MQYNTLHSMLSEASLRTQIPRFTPVTVERAKNWISKYAPQQGSKIASIISKGTRNSPRLNYLRILQRYQYPALWRGIRDRSSNSTSPVIFTPLARSTRSSRDNGDLYRVLSDAANPDWPSRGSSLIATTAYDTALEFAESNLVYLVIPSDGASIAVTGREDFLEIVPSEVAVLVALIIDHLVADIGIKQLAARLPRFSASIIRDTLGQLEALTLITNSQYTPPTPSLCRALFKRMGTFVAASDEDQLEILRDELKFVSVEGPSLSTAKFNEAKKMCLQWINDPTSNNLFDLWLPLFNYENTPAKIQTVSPSTRYKQGEVWIQSRCLLIPFSLDDGGKVTSTDVLMREIFLS